MVMRALVEVPADPHRTTTAVQRCLDQVGDGGLPSAWLAADDHDDRSVLGYSVLQRSRKDHLAEHVLVPFLAQHRSGDVLMTGSLQSVFQGPPWSVCSGVPSPARQSGQ
nr:hypothetical protein StreXyl84_79190 [Streptomyces sp. Xyl84]